MTPETLEQKAKRLANSRRNGAPRGIHLPSLKRARVDAWVTQRELSERSGVSQMTIHFLETGERGARERTVAKLADALGVKPELLVQEDRDEVA